MLGADFVLLHLVVVVDALAPFVEAREVVAVTRIEWSTIKNKFKEKKR